LIYPVCYFEEHVRVDLWRYPKAQERHARSQTLHSYASKLLVKQTQLLY